MKLDGDKLLAGKLMIDTRIKGASLTESPTLRR